MSCSLINSAVSCVSVNGLPLDGPFRVVSNIRHFSMGCWAETWLGSMHDDAIRVASSVFFISIRLLDICITNIMGLLQKRNGWRELLFTSVINIYILLFALKGVGSIEHIQF